MFFVLGAQKKMSNKHERAAAKGAGHRLRGTSQVGGIKLFRRQLDSQSFRKASVKLNKALTRARLSNHSCLKVQNPSEGISKTHQQGPGFCGSRSFPSKHHSRGYWLILRLSIQANVLISSCRRKTEEKGSKKGKSRTSPMNDPIRNKQQSKTQMKQEKKKKAQTTSDPFLLPLIVLERRRGKKA